MKMWLNSPSLCCKQHRFFDFGTITQSQYFFNIQKKKEHFNLNVFLMCLISRLGNLIRKTLLS